MQVASEAADLLRVLRQLLLVPAVGDRAQDRHQAAGRGEQHLPPQRLVHQFRQLLQRGVQELVAGHEHHHEVQRVVELLPVLLLRQVQHHQAHLRGEGLQALALPLRILLAVRLQVGFERRLGVDRQHPVARHAHHHVRAPALGLLLLDEVAVGHHAGQFDQPPQRDLAVRAAHVRARQRARQVLGFLPQPGSRPAPPPPAAASGCRSGRGAPSRSGPASRGSAAGSPAPGAGCCPAVRPCCAGVAVQGLLRQPREAVAHRLAQLLEVLLLLGPLARPAPPPAAARAARRAGAAGCSRARPRARGRRRT